MVVYRYINALSLDVVAGALICSLFFAKLFQTRLPFVVLITLGLAVWSVYTLDHLWDASRSLAPTVSFRHHFHARYQLPLKVMLILTITAGMILFWYLPLSTRKLGVFLTLVILAYFLTIHWWKNNPLYHKEALVAVVYGGGVMLGPYSLKEVDIALPHLLIAGQFILLAFCNLLVFAYFETESDNQQNFGSISGSIGKWRTKTLIIISLLVVNAGSVAGYFLNSGITGTMQGQIILALMTIPLGVVLAWPDFFKKKERYRFLGDLAFFIPLLAL